MALVRKMAVAWMVCLLSLVGAVLGGRSFEKVIVQGLESLGEDVCHIFVRESAVCGVPWVAHNIL